MKQLRYRSYQCEQLVIGKLPTDSDVEVSHVNRLRRLAESQLYVLVTEELCRLPWKDVVADAIKGGTQIIQLREKQLSDEVLRRRVNWIADACREADRLCILNDNPEIAAVSRADGVHIGQEDGDIQRVRRIIRSDQILGLSTHNVAQLTEGCKTADYLGVGPVFPSDTKSFASFAGLEFVQAAAQHATLPWFAIGGINVNNLTEVCRHGANAVAVSGAVISCDNPSAAANRLKAHLEEKSDRPLDADPQNS